MISITFNHINDTIDEMTQYTAAAADAVVADS